MASEQVTGETTVSERYAVTIPAAVRSTLDIRSGDRVRWTVDDTGSLEIEVVRTRERAFEGFEPVDMGPTHAARDLDAVLADEMEEDR